MHGKGALQLTGKLGDVMQESAKIALSYVKSQVADILEDDFFGKHDIHLHVPEGAVPKDGSFGWYHYGYGDIFSVHR